MSRSSSDTLPEGFTYALEFLAVAEETDLIEFFQTIDYGVVRMHGVDSRRRIAQFGFHYSFESNRLTPAAPIPAAIAGVRGRAAALAGVTAEDLAETLVTEYPPGAGIGWHRDAPPFGIVAGVSLGGSCRMRFQEGKGNQRLTAAIELFPRSIYVLTGPARTQWEHTIPPVKARRWSITFRTIR